MAETAVISGILEEVVEALGLDDSLFMPAEEHPVWQYTSPLDDVREWFEENTRTQIELSRDRVFTLKTFLHERSIFWPEPVLDAQLIKARRMGAMLKPLPSAMRKPGATTWGRSCSRAASPMLTSVSMGKR